MTRRICLALILGASEFAKLLPGQAPSEAFRNSARGVEQYLRSQHDGPISYRVETLFDSDLNVIEQGHKIEQVLRGNADATDLIVYYVGHGGFIDGREYYLALKSTREALDHMTGLRISSLSAIINRWFADRRLFILLDCCFAGTAVSEWQSGSNLGRVIESRTLRCLPPYGTAMLVASSKDDPAISPHGRPYTMFCECLLDVLNEGIAGAGPVMSLDEVAERLRTLIASRFGDCGAIPEIHSPRQKVGNIAKWPLFPNPAYTAPTLPEDLLAALGNPLPKVRAGAVETLRDYVMTPGSELRLIAFHELERIAGNDDSRLVKSQAIELLTRIPAPAGSYSTASGRDQDTSGDYAPSAALAVSIWPDRRRIPENGEVTWTCKVSSEGPAPVRAIELTDTAGTQLHEAFDLDAGQVREFKFTRQYGQQGGRMTIAALGRTADNGLVSAEGSCDVSVRTTQRNHSVAENPAAPSIDTPRFREATRRVKATAQLNDISVNRALRLIGEGERHYRVATGQLDASPEWDSRVVSWMAEVSALGTDEVVMVKLRPPSKQEIVQNVRRLADHIQQLTGIPIPTAEFDS